MTKPVIPPSFLFQYAMVAPRIEGISHRRGRLLSADDRAEIFVPCSLNRASRPFGLRVAWNQEGIGVEVEVKGKKLPSAGRRSDLKTSDFVTFYFDTRHTASVHRATEYCCSLVVLPCDEDANGDPTAAFVEIAQQRASKRDLDGRKCGLRNQVLSDGYLLGVWIPSSQLFGFEEVPQIGRLGFSCLVRDTELGDIPLSIGDDFPVAFDPSTWLQLELSS